jgi:hypothetical protein
MIDEIRSAPDYESKDRVRVFGNSRDFSSAAARLAGSVRGAICRSATTLR